MENPFDVIEQRLASIEEKLNVLIQKIEKPEEPFSSSPTWVTTKQFSQHLGMSTAAITNLRGKKIPFYKIGSRILFKKEEVDEFIAKTRHKTGGEYLDGYLHRS